MISLSQVLEWKYGPVAATAYVARISFDKWEDKDEVVLLTIGENKNYINPTKILSSNKTTKTLKILQINAEKYNLEYDLDFVNESALGANDGESEAVITKWVHPDKQPSKTQIQADTKAYEEHIDAIAYKEKRRVEYPDIGDQLDAIFKVLDTSNDPEADAIKQQIIAVKTKYPKP